MILNINETSNKRMSLSSAVINSDDNNDNADNGDNDDDYNINDENNNNNDESFSSLLSSSINDISKSFDWVLENPCTIMATTRTTADNDINDQQQDKENERVENEEEEMHPYVPFRLPSACEYCGCSSVRECHVFDPKCRRPETFFPKVKPPFVMALVGDVDGGTTTTTTTTTTTKI
jgi:hypothetical protein